MPVRPDMTNGHRICHGGFDLCPGRQRIRVRLQFLRRQHGGGRGVDRLPGCRSRGRYADGDGAGALAKRPQRALRDRRRQPARRDRGALPRAKPARGRPNRRGAAMNLESYVQGRWQSGTGTAVTLKDATTGEPVAYASSGGIDFRGALEHARHVGGPAIRRLSFHERAALLKALAQHLTVRTRNRSTSSPTPPARRATIRGSTSTAASARSSPMRAAAGASCRTAMSTSTAASRPCRRPEASSASTSVCRSRARRSTSTPSISRSGECSRSSRRRCSRGCRRSSSRRLRPRISPSGSYGRSSPRGCCPRARCSSSAVAWAICSST